jgi:GntR family transcriptional regulator
MWEQVANHLREEIARGTYRPGQPLPSERALADLFAVSTQVIRQATQALQAEGYLQIRRPHGTIVTDPYTRPAHTDYRTADTTADTIKATADTINEHAGQTGDAPGDEAGGVSRTLVWSPGEDPVFVRTDATAAQAELLGIPPGEPMLTRRTVQTAADGGIRRVVRLYMPFSVAADYDSPWLDDPHLPPTPEVYAWFTSSGHQLSHTDHLHARMPVAAEADALDMTGRAVPLLIVNRLSRTPRGPVVLEETSAPADKIEYAYPVTVGTED